MSSHPRQLVIDASSMTALLLDPGAGEHALVTGSQLIAPGVLPYEVANVLRRLALAGRLTAAEADQAFDDFTALAVALWDWTAIAARAWSLKANLSSYDAAYVALAELVDAPLVARDARLARAPGLGCPVELFD
ncbi:type II toxin-antitoxin system VapC family toxin [Agromyces sp. NPDC049794]|uniref:type II toxin-antitoxin system VapC family toxin n=1 Tax=unclassified Agromyces TaxID=2639701 RepID=UPI0033F1B9B7